MKRKLKFFIIFSILFMGNYSFASLEFQKGFRFYKKGVKLIKAGNEVKAQVFLKKALLNFLKIYDKKKNSAILNYYIGIMYFKGWGTKKKPELAYKYLKKAYENGTDKAACELLLVKKELKYPKIEIDALLNKIKRNNEVKTYCKKNYPTKFNLLK